MARWWWIALLLASGCGPRFEPTLPPLEEMNVLVIVIDTLGARHVGVLSEEGLDTTPHLDALAAEGVSFTRAQAPAPWTQPSVASLFTGLTPSNHGVIHLMDRLVDDRETLAELMSAHGKKTSGVISHFLINRELGYAQGFDRYDEDPVGGHRAVTSQKVTERALNELRRMRDDDFFLFVHYFDPHNVYVHHEEFSRTDDYDGPVRDWDPRINELRRRRFDMDAADVAYLRDLYREEIAYTDFHVGRLLAELEALDLRENTLVVLVADHGESFMEQGWIGHTRYLYDTFTHVPMIWSLPGTLDPAVIDAPVSLVDVMPTLMHLSGAPSKLEFDGDSLLSLFAGHELERWAARPIYSEVSFLVDANERDLQVLEKESFRSAVTRGKWKLVHDLDSEEWALYDREADPNERENLYDDEHPLVRELRPRLADWEKGKTDTWGRAFVGIEDMSPEQVERLRSLGYID